MPPNFRFDHHAKPGQLRNGNRSFAGYDGILQHGRPIPFIEALTTFLQSEVGNCCRQVRGGIEQQRSTSGVRGDQQVIGLSHRGHFAGFAYAATPRITAPALKTAGAGEPTFRPRVSQLSAVMEATTVSPPGSSMMTSVLTGPGLIWLMVPDN